MRLFTLLFLTILHQAVPAQVLSGTWKGLGWTSCESAYVELKLEQNSNTVKGESLYIFNDNRFQRYSLEGTWSPADSLLTLKEIKLIESKKPVIDVNCFSLYSFRISESTIGTQLKGNAENRTRGLIRIKCADATYELTRFTPQEFSPQADLDASLLKAALGRIEKTMQTFEVTQDSITVHLYDNGQVDGDTVSLVFNNQPVAVKLPITADLKTFTLYPDRNQKVNKLIFIAHNLGSIPPNTGTLAMKINGKAVQVFLSADLNRNATIDFIWPQLK